MKKSIVAAMALALTGFASSAHADHNSLWGEGTALDPQGVHNNRYDTLAEGGDMSQFKGSTVTRGGLDIEPRRSRPATVLPGVDSASFLTSRGSGFGGFSGGGAGRGR